MKVVVLGGMGFLGSHVCEMFKEADEEVIAIDNLTKYEYMRTGYNLEAIRNYNVDYLTEKNVIFHKEDIRDYPTMRKICKDADYIINCSAQPSMTIGIEDPVLDYTTNLTGLINLLEIARQQDIPIAHCSTIHVFGNNINKTLVKAENCRRFIRHPRLISEDQTLLDGKLTPLHASKRSGEIYMQTYQDTYGLKTFCARLSGIYGERQIGGEDHGWVANFTIRTVMNIPITIFGTDLQVRDILYVKDASRLFEHFFKYQKSGVYNCGGGKPNIISLAECLDFIYSVTKKKQDISFEEARIGDLWYFVTDISKVMRDLHWYPIIDKEDGLQNLIRWVINNKYLFKKTM